MHSGRRGSFSWLDRSLAGLLHSYLIISFLLMISSFFHCASSVEPSSGGAANQQSDAEQHHHRHTDDPADLLRSKRSHRPILHINLLAGYALVSWVRASVSQSEVLLQVRNYLKFGRQCRLIDRSIGKHALMKEGLERTYKRGKVLQGSAL